MRLYEIRWRDAAGYHREYFGKKAEAREAVASLNQRALEEATDPGNCPLDREQTFRFEEVDVPTYKKGLLFFLNLYAANADSF